MKSRERIACSCTGSQSGRSFRSSRIREHGAAMVEFAIVLPLFLTLAIGTFDMGRALWTYNTIGNASRDAARFASVRSNVSDTPATADTIAARVYSKAPSLEKSRVTVQANWRPSNNPGAIVQVRVAYAFQPVLPWTGSRTITISTATETTISN